MSTFEFKVGSSLTDDQVSYLRQSLETSFAIDAFSFESSHLRFNHDSSITSGELTNAIKKTLFISRSFNRDLVFENDVGVAYTEDPQPFLEEVRDVISVHPGFFTLQGGFLKVFKAINQRVLEIGEDLGAIEQEYPTIWPVRLYKKINYFHEFPQQVILCAAVKDDYSSRSEFAERYSNANEYETVAMDTLFAEAEYGLESAVCDCCYYGLEGTEDLQDAYYTCYNKVFRNEKSELGRLDRLTNFSVRDIMFVGTEQFVLQSRQTLIDKLHQLVESLQLRAKLETANDPFFMNDSAMKATFQNAHRLKYEILAEIPHLQKEIAVGSVNYHRDAFSNAFDIRTKEGKRAYSGCIGVGMERTTYALYCQHGPVLADWPKSVLNFLGLENQLKG